MATARTIFSHCRLVTFVVALMTLCFLTACSNNNEELVPDVEVGESVKDFKKVVRYEDSKYFNNDLDALVTFALDIRAVRWAYIYRASKGFDGNEPFCATMDELENDEYCKATTEVLYDMIDDIVGRAEEYEEAIERLQDSGVLTTPNASTRGTLSDAWDFMFSCKKTQTMGRKSVVTIMRQLGWTNNAAKLQQVYNSLPPELRRGYTSSQDFWRDFSKGTIDSRANQVFVNLYNYADPEFGDMARDLDITPGKNITVAGAELIEKGAALVIDACPIGTQIGYGKDLYGAVNATSDLVTKGDVKGFMQNAANNLINYGRDVTKLADKMRGLDINYWDYGDQFWDFVGKDISTVLMNDVCFNEHFGELDNGEGLIPNMVRTKDVNGKEITLLVMVDTNSGQTTITCVFDKEGNIVANPQLPGKKQITVVNRQTGKRATKTITVPEKGETEVEVDLEFDENLLEENPKNGELKLSPARFDDETGEGGSLRSTIITNYLYYSKKTSDDWISASIASDANFIYIKLAKNDTGKERKGQVTVMATDSKGKVLKTTVMPITQKPYVEEEESITATPSSLNFDADGGKQSISVSLPNGIKLWGADASDDMIGWATVDATIANGTTEVIVDVSKNTTEQERSGSVTIWCSYDEAGSKIDYKTTVLVKQAALDVSDFAEMIVGKWYNAVYDTGKHDVDNVIGFEFTKDGKYTWFDYNVTRTPGTNKLKLTSDEGNQVISGTYTVSGNKITFKPSSGKGYAYEGGYTWGYNMESTYMIEFEEGKNVELAKDDVLPYSGKVLRLKKTDGKVPSSYNWAYYRNLWELDDYNYEAIKSLSIGWKIYYVNSSGNYNYTYDTLSFEENDIQASKSGNSLSVSAHRIYSSWGGEYDATVSFTVGINTEGWGDLSSFKVDVKEEYKQYDNFIRVKFESPGIKHNKNSSSVWGATGEEVDVSNFYYENGGSSTTQLYGDKSGNYLRISFDY